MTPRKSVVLSFSLVLLISCTLTLLAFAAAPEKGGSQTTEAKKVEPAPSPAAEKATSDKVNINTASAADLQKIKGIGSKIAAEIVAYREANGPFKQVEDLMKVKGIGQKKFDGIKDLITIE